MTTTSSVRFFALAAVMFVSLIFLLSPTVSAHEDPEEAGRRRRFFGTMAVLDEYRSMYVLDLDKYPRPRNPLLLGEYPERIIHQIAKLKRFGTPEWTSSK